MKVFVGDWRKPRAVKEDDKPKPLPRLNRVERRKAVREARRHVRRVAVCDSRRRLQLQGDSRTLYAILRGPQTAHEPTVCIIGPLDAVRARRAATAFVGGLFGLMADAPGASG